MHIKSIQLYLNWASGVLNIARAQQPNIMRKRAEKPTDWWFKSPITLGIRQSPDPPDPKNWEIGCKVVA